MASNRRQGGTQILMAAEQEAQQLMNAARNGKMTRLKQAKEEAEKEIPEYHAQIESEFRKKDAESSVDSGSNLNRLKVETKAKIGQLKSDSAKISQDVAHMLLKQLSRSELSALRD